MGLENNNKPSAQGTDSSTTVRSPQSNRSEYAVPSSRARAPASCGMSTAPNATPNMAVGNSISRSA
jgi:hypothetical protein